MQKESVVFVLLAVGVVATFAGLAMVSRGEALGWLGVLVAAPMLYVAQRRMRLGAGSVGEP